MLEFGVAEDQVLSEKYRVLERIGEGGMGVVYAAQHLLLDQRVAIKFLSPATLSVEAVARFEREARAAAKIKSEHVVRVLDVGHLPTGAPFMVMEYLDGENLGAHLARVGPLAVEVAVDFVLQACVAMADAHVAGIVHRDLKPGNLFCVRRSDGRLLIKVLDFGISKQQRAASDPVPDSVTRTGAVLGSPLYMAPEQMRQSRDVDARADIWSLGVVLFELLAGSVPFSGVAFGELAIKIATEPAPALSTFRRDLPAGLEAVVALCLEKERELRPPDVAALATLLLPFAAEPSRALVERVQRIVQGSVSGAARSYSFPPSERASSASPPTAAAWTMTRAPSANRWALLGGATLVGVTLGAFGWVFQRARAPERSALADAGLSPDTRARPSAAAAPSAAPSVPFAHVAKGSDAGELLVEQSPRPSGKRQTLGSRRPRDGETARPGEPETSPSGVTRQPSSALLPADCDPPYTLDALGRKRFKAQCFTNSPL